MYDTLRLDLALAHLRAKYAEDQPRDDHGRFSSGGPSSASVVVGSGIVAGRTAAGDEGIAKIEGSIPGFDEIGGMDTFEYAEKVATDNAARIGSAVAEQAKNDPALRSQLEAIASADQGKMGEFALKQWGELPPEEMGARILAMRLEGAWGTTTLDGNIASWGMQLAAADLAGTDPADIRMEMSTRDLADPQFSSEGALTADKFGVEPTGPSDIEQAQAIADSPGVQASVQEMYDQTQAKFKDLGVDEVTLYRGMTFKRDDDPIGVTKTTTMPVDMYPLASWSTSGSDANWFAAGLSVEDPAEKAGRTGYVLTSTVPVDRIFSYPLTGLGAMDVSEVVVLSGPGVPAEVRPNAGPGTH